MNKRLKPCFRLVLLGVLCAACATQQVTLEVLPTDVEISLTSRDKHHFRWEELVPDDVSEIRFVAKQEPHPSSMAAPKFSVRLKNIQGYHLASISIEDQICKGEFSTVVAYDPIQFHTNYINFDYKIPWTEDIQSTLTLNKKKKRKYEHAININRERHIATHQKVAMIELMVMRGTASISNLSYIQSTEIAR